MSATTEAWLKKLLDEKQIDKDEATTAKYILSAKEFARELFEAPTPTPVMVFGCYARIYDWDEVEAQELSKDQLALSIAFAKRLFEAHPAPETVFMLFDNWFGGPPE